MDLTAALYGYGETGDARHDAVTAVTHALKALVTLDINVTSNPVTPVWLRLEHAVAGAQAARESGAVAADLQIILRARIGLLALPRGHVGLGDLDARARRWTRVRRRDGERELRALIAALAPRRGSLDLVTLAGDIAGALARVSSSTLQVAAGEGGAVAEVVSAPGPDLADLMLAVPFALRRIGVTRQLLPAVSGRVRVFASEGLAPLEPLTRWAQTLAGQAGEGAARLRLLERYVASVDARLIKVRRPAALRRLVGVGLNRWAVWAAQLARETQVDISSAWRTLEQAAALGLVERVPGQGTSRGNGTLYAIPPWLQLAGLISAPRGRPAAAPIVTGATAWVPGLGQVTETMVSALDDMDAAIAAADRLLGAGPNEEGAP